MATLMVTREAVIAAARGWLGTPYRHQASVKGAGCDCLGLIRGVWREMCGPEPERLPPYARDWGDVDGADLLLQAARRHLTEIGVGEVKGGDVLAFRVHGRSVKHAGILAAADRFIHSVEHAGVIEIELTGWWRRRVAAAFSFPGIK